MDFLVDELDGFCLNESNCHPYLEITPLEELHDRLRARLDLSKSKLEEFKAQFPV